MWVKMTYFFLRFNFDGILFNFHHETLRLSGCVDELRLKTSEFLLHDDDLGSGELQFAQTDIVTLFLLQQITLFVQPQSFEIGQKF